MPLSGQLISCILHFFHCLRINYTQGLKLEPWHVYVQIKKCLEPNTVQPTITLVLFLLALAQPCLSFPSSCDRSCDSRSPEKQASYSWPHKFSMLSGLCLFGTLAFAWWTPVITKGWLEKRHETGNITQRQGFLCFSLNLTQTHIQQFCCVYDHNFLECLQNITLMGKVKIRSAVSPIWDTALDSSQSFQRGIQQTG